MPKPITPQNSDPVDGARSAHQASAKQAASGIADNRADASPMAASDDVISDHAATASSRSGDTNTGLYRRSAERRSTDLPRQHSLRWWSIKVVSGTTLISAVILQFIYGLSATVNVPTIIGQSFAVLGFGLVMYHYMLLKRLNHNIESPSILITDQGLYRRVRHPMYLADVCWTLGLLLLYTNLATLAVFCLGCYALYRQALDEEAFLAQRFGPAFTQWQQRTGLLIPKLFTQ